MALIFKKIRWKNLLSSGNIFTEIILNESASTLIIGDNGAGKSTFLEAITYALYGKPFRRINKPQLINSINQKGLLVELEFAIGNKDFLIRRGMKPNIFEIIQDDKLINQDAAIRDYQDFLEKNIIRLNYKSFTQIVTLGSRSFIPFMQLTAHNRREVIEDLLDLQIFSVMNTILKQKVTDNKHEIREVKYNTDLVQEKIRLQKEYIKSLNENHDKQIQNNNVKIADYTTEIEEINKLIADYEIESSGYLSVITGNSTVAKKLDEIKFINKQFTSKLEKLTVEIDFYTENDSCPTCKQGIEEHFKCEAINTKTLAIDESKEKLAELSSLYDNLNQKMAKVTEASENMQRVNSKITEAKSKIRSNTEFIIKIKEENKRLSAEHKENSADKDKLETLKDTLKLYISQHQSLVERKSVLDVVSVLLKDGGIKSKIIKQYIPIMNKLINKYLAAMELNCSFELDENFNEVVKSRYRDEFSYDSFSEGEKARIDLAIMFAWRAIAKLRNSNSSNLLILDETFDGSLDNTGMEELLKILLSITADSNVFVISHKPDQMVDKFSNIIRFEKYKNFSRIKEDSE